MQKPKSPLSLNQLRSLYNAAEEAAGTAGKLLNSRASTKKRVAYKGKVNLVTEVDTLSERSIVRYLAKRFPEHSFLAEEGGATRQRKTRAADSIPQFQWVIDPLDGTTNYFHGYRVYSVSVALRLLHSASEHKSGNSAGTIQQLATTILGVVYDPNLDELFGAIAGHGARLNGKRIKVSATASLSKSLVATGFPYDVGESKTNNLDHFADFAVRAQAVRRAGSAALDLCHVACGRLDGFWELKLGPWDTAAGELIVREAGGKVTDFAGGGFNIFQKQIAASNGRIHRQILKTLALSPRLC